MKNNTYTFFFASYRSSFYGRKTNQFDHSQAEKGMELSGDCWVPWCDFAVLVPQEIPLIALKSPPGSCCCALVVHCTLHRPSLCSVSSLAHRSHIPSPHCHCKNCCCTPLQPTNALADSVLFARSREKANVTLKVIHHGTVL